MDYKIMNSYNSQRKTRLNVFDQLFPVSEGQSLCESESTDDSEEKMAIKELAELYLWKFGTLFIMLFLMLIIILLYLFNLTIYLYFVV